MTRALSPPASAEEPGAFRDVGLLTLFPALTAEPRQASRTVKERVAKNVAVKNLDVIVFRFIILAPFRFC